MNGSAEREEIGCGIDGCAMQQGREEEEW